MTDADDSIPEPRRPVLRPRLPRIRDIKIDWVAYAPPKLRYVEPLRPAEEAVLAIDLELDGPIRLDTDVTPALFVGDEMLVESVRLENQRVRFYAFEPQADRLEPLAPIMLGWPGVGPQKGGREAFSFERPDRR
ncbi:hypothetical protein [Amaricoccus sp.]|uniref:hypothetical protein n=1 Tax=Amaricoccus sp. TaxID=1872485 RepID=UPI001B5DF1BB|nr:hypothetical protein [Amaricoccus sp.]MBP7002306.1 hypothetical protein [Amaricoccus sp.]